MTAVLPTRVAFYQTIHVLCRLQEEGNTSDQDDTTADSQQTLQQQAQQQQHKNNNSVAKPVTPGPGEHLLQYTYCFWYSKKSGRTNDAASFEKNMKIVGTFCTVSGLEKVLLMI